MKDDLREYRHAVWEYRAAFKARMSLVDSLRKMEEAFTSLSEEGKKEAERFFENAQKNWP